MKANVVFLILVIVISAYSSKAQIKVLSNGNVGLGVGNSNPGSAVDLLGSTLIRPSSGGVYLQINSGSNGFVMNPSSAHNGDIGYQCSFHTVNSDYVYSNGVLLTSDSKLKKNVKSLEAAMPLIKRLRPVTFDYIADYSRVENEKVKSELTNDSKNRLGFIAQEVQQVIPQAVKERESDTTLCIRMDDFIPLLVKGLQEQTAQIDSLKTVIQEMKNSESMLKSANVPGDGNTLNSSAMLYQNMPNPFSRETNIGCQIPETANTSVLYIYNMNGVQLQQYPVNGKGKQTITISGNSLEPGLYLYALVVDGREVDTKRMILTK